MPQEFTLAGYRQRSALAAELPLGDTALLDTALSLAASGSPELQGGTTPHSAAVQEGALTLPRGFVSNVSLFRGTFR